MPELTNREKVYYDSTLLENTFDNTFQFDVIPGNSWVIRTGRFPPLPLVQRNPPISLSLLYPAHFPVTVKWVVSEKQCEMIRMD